MKWNIGNWSVSQPIYTYVWCKLHLKKWHSILFSLILNFFYLLNLFNNTFFFAYSFLVYVWRTYIICFCWCADCHVVVTPICARKLKCGYIVSFVPPSYYKNTTKTWISHTDPWNKNSVLKHFFITIKKYLYNCPTDKDINLAIQQLNNSAAGASGIRAEIYKALATNPETFSTIQKNTRLLYRRDTAGGI